MRIQKRICEIWTLWLGLLKVLSWNKYLFLGEARDDANRDVEIKDLYEAVEIINKLSNRAKVALAEHIILWFEDISLVGSYNTLFRFLSREKKYYDDCIGGNDASLYSSWCVYDP